MPSHDHGVISQDESIRRHLAILEENRRQNPVGGPALAANDAGFTGSTTAGVIAPPEPRTRRLPRASGPVRVGAFSPIIYPGGAETMFLALARATRQRLDWQGCVVLGNQPDDPALSALIGAVMPLFRGVEEAVALAARVDVLVTYGIDDLDGVLSRVENPPKVIATIHAPPGDPWGDLVYARHAGIDQWVAVSELALAALPPPSRAAAPASVIWNAVDADRLQVRRDRAEMRRIWGVPVGAPVAGFYQRLSPEKDPLAALRLARSLPAAWHVVVVGRGPLRAELRAAGLANLHVFDADPDAGDVLNAFDVLVVPSRYESFGLTMAEGLYLGRPVVSTNVGVARLRPGLTRLVADLAGGDELAAAVLAARAPLPGATAFAQARFGPARFARQWTRLIERLGGGADPNDPWLVRDRADRCLHGSGPCGCGTLPRTCHRDGGRRDVFRGDCLACQTVAIGA